MMQNLANEFAGIVEQSALALAKISEAAAGLREGEDRWSKKEILGHLIDSAANNHQRFVRVQLTDGLSMPGYEQNAWVERQAYQTAEWSALVALWKSYNLHLAHVISHIPEACLNHRVTVGDGEPVTLEFLIRDYVRHLQHHLDQIFR